MNLLLAITEQDGMVHVTRGNPSRDLDLHTLCGHEVIATMGVEPVPDEKACVGCANELGPHDHIPLVSDRKE